MNLHILTLTSITGMHMYLRLATLKSFPIHFFELPASLKLSADIARFIKSENKVCNYILTNINIKLNY